MGTRSFQRRHDAPQAGRPGAGAPGASAAEHLAPQPDVQRRGEQHHAPEQVMIACHGRPKLFL